LSLFHETVPDSAKVHIPVEDPQLRRFFSHHSTIVFVWLVYLQQIKKKATAEGKTCHAKAED
jgi:hypothetical protein